MAWEWSTKLLTRNRKSAAERRPPSTLVTPGCLLVQHILSPLLEILAEQSGTRPLASAHDGYAMIPRTFSAVKKRVALTAPVRKRDASTSPGVGTKARAVLSRLPIPPLRSTLDKYLQSIKPLLLQDDLRGISAYDPSYQRRVEWAKEFETGVGATLQARLIGINHHNRCTHCIHS